MTPPAASRPPEALNRKPVSTLWCLSRARFFYALVLLHLANAGQAQSMLTEVTTVRSVSGQFTVTAPRQFSPLLHRADLATNTSLVRLEPALLAITAERFRAALWPLLGIRADAAWSGKIFLALHPARTVTDEVNLNIVPLPQAWNYRVDLPDLLPQPRFARSMTATILLEFANRQNRNAEHSVELPPWLVDGLAQLVLGTEPEKVILSAPEKKVGGVMESRVNKKTRGPDPLAIARETLRNTVPPSFDDLCWPTGIQLDGHDGGAYLAGAQLFASELLSLKNGPEMMRDFLSRLGGCLNWQTAFFAAFHNQFRRPLDVEKWWALRIVRFAARDRGPRWSVDASRDQLAAVLAVPVEFRASPDALPQHAQVSLQMALKNFSGTERETVLRLKQRDLELAQFRLAAPYAGLADGYRSALAEFLGDNPTAQNNPADKRTRARHTASASETMRKLDVLDIRRREFEQKLDANPLPRNAKQPPH